MGEGLKKTAKGWTYNGKLLSPAEQRFHDKIAALTPEQRQEIAFWREIWAARPKAELLLCVRRR